MSDGDVRELKEELSRVRNELSNLSGHVAALTSTVNLLVEGKIKTDDKPLMTAMDIIKASMLALIGAISGYFAGRS